MFGRFNMLKTGSPWRDVRLRQAVNVAINRDDLIRYATKGNGVIVPALLAVNAFGYNPDLAPYAFDPVKARALLREAGYPDGLAVTLLAPRRWKSRPPWSGRCWSRSASPWNAKSSTPVVYNQKTRLPDLDQPAEQQAWDIALTSFNDMVDFPALEPYHLFALGGPRDWVLEEPELRSCMRRFSAPWIGHNSRRSSARWNGTPGTTRIFSSCITPLNSTR